MRRLLLLVLCCSACEVKIPGGGGTGGGGGNGAGTPPSIDLTVFSAVGGSASKLLADVGNARLEIDPTQKDALTALGHCADLLSYCYAAGGATVTQCFARSAKCTTSEPWNEQQPCCAQKCADDFEAAMSGGMNHVDALERVLFRDYCMPGVRELMEAP